MPRGRLAKAVGRFRRHAERECYITINRAENAGVSARSIAKRKPYMLTVGTASTRLSAEEAMDIIASGIELFYDRIGDLSGGKKS